ncbi:CST complex subunit STN1 [Malania oleifera]|uniref:CST complex subunit STN1 n=1 Tax=Malania oleifera TaxID=397392 RepID=UPI0025ADACDD|nr:CST complex subunit STN1 [Malania oleifera]
MDSLYNIHVKLLAFDLLSLTPHPSPSSSTSSSSDPTSFSRKGRAISRVEAVGTVASRELKPDKFLKFTIDDGTGCIPCVLWLNQLKSPYFSRRNPPDVRLIAEIAAHFSAQIHLGGVVRVRGRITAFRGALQITVSDVVVEKDPNIEILHWLDCIKLAHKCYDVRPTGKGQRL